MLQKTPAPPELPLFLTIKEAANVIRISGAYLYDVIKGRRGTSKPRVIKFGRVYRIPRDDFIAWANAQTPPRVPLKESEPPQRKKR